MLRGVALFFTIRAGAYSIRIIGRENIRIHIFNFISIILNSERKRDREKGNNIRIFIFMIRVAL